MSVIDGKTTVIGECWDYAFIFRPIFAVAIATILMFWVFIGLTVLISAKLIIESSGMYTQIQTDLAAANERDGTAWTFP